MNRHRWMMVAALAGSVTACQPTLEESIVGTWKNEDGTMMLRFSDDGTFATSAPGGSTRGRYQMAEDGNMRMDFDDQSAEVVVSVSQDKLDFCQPNHRCDAFRKAE